MENETAKDSEVTNEELLGAIEESDSADGTAGQNKSAEVVDEGKPEGEPKSDEDGKDKGDKYAKILENRNAKREAAAQKAEESLATERRLEALEKVVNGKSDTVEDENGDKIQLTPDQAQTMIQEMVDKAFSKRDQASLTEEADQKEVSDYISKNPNAEKYKDQILKAMKVHTTLSSEAVYYMILGMDRDSEVVPSDTKKTSIGSRSKSSLQKGGKMVGQMDTKELTGELIKEVSSGNLKL